MKIAAVQFAPIFRDPTNNLNMAVNLVTKAAQAGAKLVVLPELCTSGYSFMSRGQATRYAENIENYPNGWSRSNVPTCMRRMHELADQYSVAIAWGMMTIADVNRGNTLYNSQVLMLPGGEFKTYNKVNLWGNDFLWATSGKESPPIVDYLGKKIGLLICRDVRDKSSGFKDFYEKGDADIVVFSSNFGDGGFPSVTWMDFAKDNRVTFVVSNRYGREQNNNFGEGGICIIEPPAQGQEYGPVHCEGLLWEKPCIVYADVP